MVLAIYGTGGHAKSIYNLVKKKQKIYFFDEKKKFLKLLTKNLLLGEVLKSY